MKSNFITILTASLNNGKTIEKTLRSVRSQSYQNLEHFVIDGGSRDNTVEILKKYTSTYNLTWISEPDHGIADALNKGLRKARGQYILVIHADDRLLSPNSLERFYPALMNERFDIYSCPVVLDHPVKGKILVKPIKLLWWHRFKNIFLHQGSFVHRRMFEQIGPFRTQFSINLDYDFFYRCLIDGGKVKFDRRPLALMGGTGIGSNRDFLTTRLREEALVQHLNEKNAFWQSAQLLFRTLYLPYKTRLLPKTSAVLRQK
jgi:glycosyltransferase involved in cell wall biosynthesis